MQDGSLNWIIPIAMAATFAMLCLIIWKAKRNSRLDAQAMIEEKPRKMWYQLGCRECAKPTPHAQITDGLCPDCYAPVEAAADVPIEITMPMLNAGIAVLRGSPQRDAQTATEMFNAMLRAMPVEQKRALMRNIVPQKDAA